MHFWNYVDWFAGVSAGLQSALAILGIVVTLRENWAKRHPWSLIASFSVLATFGVVITIAQSAKSGRETAAASAKVSTSLNKLDLSTQETNRLTTLNTQLQEKLLKSEDTVLQLSRETKYQVTGERGYCYLIPVINPIGGDAAGLPLLVVNPTKYPVIGVIADIMEQIRPGDTQDAISQKLQNTVSLSLGDVSNTFARGTGYRLPVRRDRDNKFQINIFSRGKQQNEFLVVTWNSGIWNVDYELPGRNKEIRPNFPYIEKDH